MERIEYRNRHNDLIVFVPHTENSYRIEMPDFCRKYLRLGGKEGQTYIDQNDLGFVDPPGGPFITAGFDIKGKTVKKIFYDGDDLIFEVGDCDD